MPQTELESQFTSWASSPSASEEEKCARAVRMVRQAISSHGEISRLDINVFAQGSYRNRTNVPRESDVDIGVLCLDVIFPSYAFAQNLDNRTVGLIDSSISYGQFKNQVGAALRAYFGSDSMTRGDKAFNIHETSSRVDADVVPVFKHRRYVGNPSYFSYLSGTEFQSDSGARIVNWPEQQHQNGLQKHSSTNRRFKRVVRAVKGLCYQMQDEGIASARPIPSFLVECLIWNVPDNLFGAPTLIEDIRNAIAYLARQTSNRACDEWGEESELKYLFRDGQPWTVEQAATFLIDAGRRAGFW